MLCDCGNIQMVVEWMGHSGEVARQHYLRMDESNLAPATHRQIERLVTRIGENEGEPTKKSEPQVLRFEDFGRKRASGFEPPTSSLGSWHSTTELRPQRRKSSFPAYCRGFHHPVKLSAIHFVTFRHAIHSFRHSWLAAKCQIYVRNTDPQIRNRGGPNGPLTFAATSFA